MSTKRILTFPLQRTDDYSSARRPVIVTHETTPSSRGSVPLRTRWPENPAGKPLTDRRIRVYEAAGVYGPEAQRRAQERESAKAAERRTAKARERVRQALLSKYV